MTSFSELGLSPPIAAAIAEKKFEKATRVQAAVMNPELRGRDLLVSSETGSGKTLAFGAVLARELLAEDGKADGKQVASGKVRPPRALVIAPTRELATQVRGELAWLFAKTGWRLGVFTGGTDIWGDLRTIKMGVDVVVGTPGRLVDLVERGALPLATVEAVVLDEADEMLDMGFREDLEKLLGAASARRLSLLFSATLPADILRLAGRYQKNAARIDTRQGSTAPHADIHYVAYLTAVGEKFPAVMNILRIHDAKRSIIFGTTREGVASLHEALAQRGVRAVVLSGDRSQADRDRALATLKRGEASVLVATNVAARGLDLPEVDLVIHADLPSNVEALTHRSGRTGRAGRKGTSVLVAQVTERRKAERLMSMARLQAPWQAPPDAAAVAAMAEQRLWTALARELGLEQGSDDGDVDEDNGDEVAAEGQTSDGQAGDDSTNGEGEKAVAVAKTKPRSAAERALDGRADAFLARLGDVDQRALLHGLLRRELARLPAGDRVTPVGGVGSSSSSRDQAGGATPADRRARFAGGAVLFRVNVGIRQNAEPGWLLPLICRRGGITRKDVGAIRTGPHSSEFEISSEAANAFALAAAQPDPRAPQVNIERVDAPQNERPSSRPAAAPPRSSAAKRPPARVASTSPESVIASSSEAAEPVPAKSASKSKHAVAARHADEPAAKHEDEPAAEHVEKKRVEKQHAAKHEDEPAAKDEDEPATEHVEKKHVEKKHAVSADDAAHSSEPQADVASELAEPAPIAAPKAKHAKPRAEHAPTEKIAAKTKAGDKPSERKSAEHVHAARGDRAAAPRDHEERPRAAKPYGAKPYGAKPAFGTKPVFGAKPYPGKSSFGGKVFGPKSKDKADDERAAPAKAYGAKPFDAKPYGAKPAFGTKPVFGTKPYPPKSAFGGKVFTPKSRDKAEDERPASAKPFGAKPAYGAKPAFGAKPAYGAKPAFGARSAAAKEAPARTSFTGSRPSFVKGGDSSPTRSRASAPVKAGAGRPRTGPRER